MKIPYVIENQKHTLKEVLNDMLAEEDGRSFDVATAYFSVRGFEMLRANLQNLQSFRLLLGDEPTEGLQLGLKTTRKAYPRLLRQELEQEELTSQTATMVEDLIRFLRQEKVEVRLFKKGFLHAKCYLLYGDRPGGQRFVFERFQPLVGIVGSSNFTAPGLTSNRELNLTHRVLREPDENIDLHASQMVGYLAEVRLNNTISPMNRQLLKSEVGASAILELVEWYNGIWGESEDFKEGLIEVLDASKFGTVEYTPYEVYMKALFEYFQDDLETQPEESIRSAVDLAEFQEDAVRKARKIIAQHNGVIVADSVGLGKTWIGKKLLEDFAYHQRMKAVVICPASLRSMWEKELHDATISAQIISHEGLGQEDFPAHEYSEVDVILIDESHNFRNHSAQRYGNLDRIISLNGGRGRSGARKKLIMLTATPINNTIFDLYNQINLIARNDQSYFASAGIGDLRKYFIRARKEANEGRGLISLYNLLDEVVIRRTRQFIHKAYPEATIQGRKICFPDRKLRTVRYDLEATYAGIYQDIVAGIDSLQLAPYNLESYKKDEAVKAGSHQAHELVLGREEALVGIFKTRYLKRFESSIEAFRISVRRALQFQQTYESYILEGKVLSSSDFRKAMSYLSPEEEEDDTTIATLADKLDTIEDVREIIDQLPQADPAAYDLRKLHGALQHDIRVLETIWDRIKTITPDRDAKLEKLKEMLGGVLRGKKVLIFSYFKDTVRYLFRELGGDPGTNFRTSIGDPNIHRMDSGTNQRDRARIIQAFAPRANDHPEIAGTDKEIDIMISTDVLSEGHNLQDCGVLLNYDLHWNPTRMVQRAGRIDRIGTQFDTLWIYNMFPDEGLERLLRLVESLSQKIENINNVGFLDASVLGEEVQPRTFNTLRRIRDEDDSVVEEEEQFAELVSPEFLIQQLRDLLNTQGRESLDRLPDGIHSGLERVNASGMFFYFKGQMEGEDRVYHYWRYYDALTNTIIDNRYQISSLISCQPDTPRVIGTIDPYQVQEIIITDILGQEQEMQALEAAPRTIDPIQGTLSILLQGHLHSPALQRKQLLRVITYLNQPLPAVQVRELKRVQQDYATASDIEAAVGGILQIMTTFGTETDTGGAAPSRGRLRRENLRLICYEYVVG